MSPIQAMLLDKMPKFTLLLLCFILMLAPAVSLAQEDAAKVDPQNELTAEEKLELEMGEKLKTMTVEERFNLPVSLDLRNIDVIDALKFLASKGNLNIVATKNVAGRVTLNIQNVPIKDVFDFVLRSNSLAFIRQGDVFNVMTEAEYRAFYGENFFVLKLFI